MTVIYKKIAQSSCHQLSLFTKWLLCLLTTSILSIPTEQKKLQPDTAEQELEEADAQDQQQIANKNIVG